MIMCCQLLLVLASTGGFHPSPSAQSMTPTSINRSPAQPLSHAWLDLEGPAVEDDEVDKQRSLEPRQPPIDCALLPVTSRVFFARALKLVWVAPLTETLHDAISIGLARGPPPLA